MDNKNNRIEKFIKYYTIISWSLAIFTLIFYILSIIIKSKFSFYDFIRDELTFILMPFVLKGAYLIRKKYENNEWK